MEKYSKYGPLVLRIGLSAVVLWFSVSQFLGAQDWVAYVPDSIVSMFGVSALTLVYLNAIFELVFGVMLLLGIFTRISALLLALHLFEISYIVGYGQTGVRDFGLAVAILSIFFTGSDAWCIDYKTKVTNNN